jgi:hypothetical protein
LEQLEQAIAAELSVNKAHKHMTFLVEEVGERLAGTESIQKAAGYIRDELERCGLEARVDRFPIYQSYPGSAALRVLHPEERAIEALPSCHIPSTLDEGMAGELVYVGAGGHQDYDDLDVRDRLVLADMTWAPPRPEKARIALEHGAKALIILNWGTPDNPTIQRGAIKGVWGNPTPESFQRIPRIPAINVTKAAGEYLKGLCAQGSVRVWMRADASQEWVLANQPVGVLRAAEETDEFVLVGSHLEGWGKTAICNSSGNALSMELARALALNRDRLKRNVIFAFWDGHEISEAAGSTHFVDTHWDKLSRYCIAYVDIDNPGIAGTSIPNARSAPEIKGFVLDIVDEVWGDRGTWKMPYKGGDQSFFGVGVPYVSFATGYTPEELERLNWAFLSPWLHTEADTLDKVDRELYDRHLRFFATLVLRLCNSVSLPYDLSQPVALLMSHLEALKELASCVEAVDLDGLVEKTARLGKAVGLLPRAEQAGKKGRRHVNEGFINEGLMKASREISFLWTEADKYEQDPYGYTLIGKPIPRLLVPIERLRELEPGGQDFNLWLTELLRQKNRVADAIDRATDWLTWAALCQEGSG